jgi:hypothetical protein
MEESVEPVLTFPGVADHVGILTALSTPERGPDGGPLAVVPGGLDEDVTYAGVASLGDTTEPSAIARGVLAGHEADVGHELTGALEAAHVAELGDEDHRGLGLEAAEAADAVDQGLVAWEEGEVVNATVELVPALELVLEEGEVLGEHRAVLVGQGVGLEHLADPVEMADGPVRALAVEEAASAQELENVVARLDDLALEGLAARSRTRSSASEGMVIRTRRSMPQSVRERWSV